jgi:glycosyltransferase involved in cell wall biosynthesis
MELALAARIREGGCDFVSLGLSARRGLLEGAAALRRMLRAGAPDVIHCHTARAVGMVALSGFRGRVVLTHHNSRLSFSRHLFRLFDRVVDHYIAISPETAAIYRRNSRQPFAVIANAAAGDFAASEPRQAIGSPCRILSVGAVSEQKNYELLLETALHLRDRAGIGPMPHFAIAGGGADLERMRERGRGLGLGEIVEFLGERGDVRALMERADLFLNTSLYEGQPVAMLEAMAMALPIVATDVPGNRELVTCDVNGLHGALGDPGSMARAIDRIVTDSALYRALSQGAVRQSRQYTIAGSARRHLAVYRSGRGNTDSSPIRTTLIEPAFRRMPRFNSPQTDSIVWP